MTEPSGSRGTALALGLGSGLIHVAAMGLLLVAAAGGSRRLGYLLERGGGGTYASLLLGGVGALGLLAFAVWLSQPKRGGGWLMLAAPIAVVLSGTFFERRGVSKAYAAVAGESINPDLRARVFAMGASEAASNTLVALVVAAVLTSGVAGVFAARSLGRHKPRLGKPAKAALVTGASALIALIATSLATPAFQLTALLWFPTCSGLLSIVLAAMAIHAEDQEPTALGDLLAAGACSVAAVALACVAIWGSSLTQALAGAGAEAVDPAQQARIVREGLELSQSAYQNLAFVLPGLLASLAALISTRHKLTRGAAANRGALLATAGLVLAALLGVLWPRKGDVKQLADFASKIYPDDVTRPVVSANPVRSSWSRLLFLGKRRIWARNDEHGLQDLGPAEALDGPRCVGVLQSARENGHYRAVLVDSEASFRRMYCVALALVADFSSDDESHQPQFGIAPLRIQRGGEVIGWLAATERLELPLPFDVMGSPNVELPIAIEANNEPRRQHHIHLKRDYWQLRADTAVAKLDGDVAARLETLGKRLGSEAEIDLSADADVAAGDVLRVAALAHTRIPMLGSAEKFLAATPEASEDSGAQPARLRIRVGASSISGKLPPEVVARLLRQRFGKVHACYRQGVARTPDLEGLVTVRFVIKRDGSISGLKGSASESTDSELVACVERAFSGMSFPEPESGIVTVEYPLIFGPN